MEERPLAHRVLAALAVVALLGAGSVCSWWVLTDQIQLPQAETVGSRDEGGPPPVAIEVLAPPPR